MSSLKSRAKHKQNDPAPSQQGIQSNIQSSSSSTDFSNRMSSFGRRASRGRRSYAEQKKSKIFDSDFETAKIQDKIIQAEVVVWSNDDCSVITTGDSDCSVSKDLAVSLRLKRSFTSIAQNRGVKKVRKKKKRLEKYSLLRFVGKNVTVRKIVVICVISISSMLVCQFYILRGKQLQPSKDVVNTIYEVSREIVPRVFFLHGITPADVALDFTQPGIPFDAKMHRVNEQYPAEFSDRTQLYSLLDSSDEALSHMEIRRPLIDGECVPMQVWQTVFHPSCNSIHEYDLLGKNDTTRLFGKKGFWRHAWSRVREIDGKEEKIVLKTLKPEHNFEDAFFEFNRVDAISMERLTSSPHVINIYAYCGHSVVNDFADGPRLGDVANKIKGKPIEMLKIAADIAEGLADVHGIDGDGNATFVHFDINPANVISVNGSLKLNDFNIGVLRKWNVTSGEPCGIPTKFPNPQWRSPEEALRSTHLTEKVDVFSLGHIFFRIICGNEPWNKLEPGGKPLKETINKKVRNGTLPFIPLHVMNSTDPAKKAIRDAMLDCYTFDPARRPSARSIADRLKISLSELNQIQKR